MILVFSHQHDYPQFNLRHQQYALAHKDCKQDNSVETNQTALIYCSIVFY